MRTKITISVFMLIASVFLVPSPTSQAQTVYQPIYAGRLAFDLQWSSDSTYLAFVTNPYLPDERWQRYDPKTKTLVAMNSWPLMPQLTNNERKAFDVAGNKGAFVYTSSDSRFLIYAGTIHPEQEGASWDMMLMDRRTGTQAKLPFPLLWPFEYAVNFNVVWNKSGTAFAVNQRYHLGDVARVVSGYTKQIGSGLNYIQNVFIESFQIKDVSYYAELVYSISSSGNQLLMKARDNDYKVNLVWFDSANPKNSFNTGIDAITIAGAMLDSNDEHKALIIGQSGLIRYDLRTHSITLLNSQLKKGWIDLATFSPDGKWLAFQDDIGAIFVVNLRDAVLSNSVN